jgi:hypothetical protein
MTSIEIIPRQEDSPMNASLRQFWVTITGGKANSKRTRIRIRSTRTRTGAGRGPLDVLEGRALLSGTTQTLAYTGPVIHSIDYGATWPNWKHPSDALNQFNDSDFANSSFAGLWGQDGGVGRNDLKTMHDGGYNSIRLYNWGPTRGWVSVADDAIGYGTAHRSFLEEADKNGLKVIVPVSNYFLSNDQFAWAGQSPDADFSFKSAPEGIQKDLMYFVSSIAKEVSIDPSTGGITSATIEPSVFMIDVGNEIDLKLKQPGAEPNGTQKLERADWWVVNLHDQLSKAYGASAPLLSIGISNADQNVNSPSKRSWFQVFAQGVDAAQNDKQPSSPDSDVNGTTFTHNVKGLNSYPWYTTSFVNTVNIFQPATAQNPGDQTLPATLKQYDTGVPSGTNWSQTWPGSYNLARPNVPFPVPLLLTEMGISRDGRSEQQEFDYVTQDAQAAENYMAASSNHHIMGYTIFEFNDEPNIDQSRNGNPAPYNDATFGIFKYYSTNNINDFRNGHKLRDLETHETKVSFGTMPSRSYPVYELFPVKSDAGQSIYDKLKAIMSFHPVNPKKR